MPSASVRVKSSVLSLVNLSIAYRKLRGSPGSGAICSGVLAGSSNGDSTRIRVRSLLLRDRSTIRLPAGSCVKPVTGIVWGRPAHVLGKLAVQDHVDNRRILDDPSNPQTPEHRIAADHVEHDRREDAAERVGIFLESIAVGVRRADAIHHLALSTLVSVADLDHVGDDRLGQVGLGNDLQVRAAGDSGDAVGETVDQPVATFAATTRRTRESPGAPKRPPAWD